MPEKNSAQQDGVVRRVGRWSTAAAVVITEAAQHYVDPGSTLETVVDHANTGAIWGLGFQLVAMLGRELYKALPSNGSVSANVTWGINNRGDGEASAKGDPAPPPTPAAVPEARPKESVPENEKHGA